MFSNVFIYLNFAILNILVSNAYANLNSFIIVFFVIRAALFVVSYYGIIVLLREVFLLVLFRFTDFKVIKAVSGDIILVVVGVRSW